MICQVAQDEGKFDLESAAKDIADKLIRRHPHVFGDTKVKGAGEVLERWEEIKKREKEEKPESDQSALSGVPRAMPALLRALRMGEKASLLGFDWPDPRSSLDKIREETAEVEEELRKGEKEGSERLFQEVGDLLFAVANAGRLLGINPEMALRATLDRFDTRFRRMEKDLGKPMKDATFEELDQAWNEAKEAIRREGNEGGGEGV
jgi:MazG family protein